MTGGLSGIEGRAAKWEEKAVDELKRQRIRVQADLNEIHKRRKPREKEMSDMNTQVPYHRIDMPAFVDSGPFF